MYSLNELKMLLGDECEFKALLTTARVKEILENKEFSYSDHVPFVLEVGNLDIEITIFADMEKLWLGYDCCQKVDGEWESYDVIPDPVNLDVEDIEAEMFRVLDNFAKENGLSYFTQDSKHNFDYDMDYEDGLEMQENFSCSKQVNYNKQFIDEAFRMRKLTTRGKKIMNDTKSRVIAVVQDERGEGFLDVLIKILITVIIGAALLALLRSAIPSLFQDILDKMRSVFTI